MSVVRTVWQCGSFGIIIRHLVSNVLSELNKNSNVSVLCDGALYSWRPWPKSHSWCILLL